MGRFIVITKEDFKNKFWKKPENMFYGKDVSAVPVALEEIRFAALSFPIVFTKNKEERFVPVVLLNIKPDGNLFVDKNGRWTGRYIPWFFLAYPFRLALTEKQEPVLTIDEDYITEGEGEPFFDENGDPTKEVLNMLQFLMRREKSYKDAFQICDKLKDMNVFEPMNIKIKKEVVKGLYRINPKKIDELEDKEFLNLRKTNALILIYAHIFSLPNMNILIKLFQQKREQEEIKLKAEDIISSLENL